MRKRLDLYLKTMVKEGGSDLHIKSGTNVRVRLLGKLKKRGGDIFSSFEVEDLVKEITNDEEYKRLYEEQNLDFSYVSSDEGRYRVNFFFQLEGLSAVFRIIPTDIPTLEKLNLPAVIETFTEIQRGLILVTGVTGSGKSTTLAAILDRINKRTEKHIITVEDPIEFIHKDLGCLINQRAIGLHSRSFASALRGALREDPDIILVGEMRDLETIEIALHASNTGHLVFSTLHTIDAKETIDRIVGMFSNEEQNRIRSSLASVLHGVISQRLVPTIGGGRAAVIEVLKKTKRIETLIVEKRDSEIPDALFEGKELYGTQTFDQALLDLFQEKRVTQETVLEYATNPSDMKLKLQGVGKGAVAVDNSEESEEVFGFK